ncbi:tRNA preQ1(34) S-adenosylmethionine ribosyltransferase-isomerase QueA [Deltaproteobacteria bacterium Smac51]|nr:tRNA preQ1(34) S-adenosylmethionine ribosyltransferase-isomerase QueA [Deltaproteobacteria bacterium Smac51]
MTPYMFDLPAERIAQKPPEKRGASRLMLLDRSRESVSIGPFDGLPGLLPDRALLIFNEVRVTPARLRGMKPGSGGQVEAFILQPPEAGAEAGDYDLWCLAQPGRRIKPGAELVFSREGTDERLNGEVLDVNEAGQRLIRFHFQRKPVEVLEAIGHVPLPTYIKRPDGPEDRSRYQTVYGKTPGAVAAPTAGLHFTGEMLKSLEQHGFQRAFVTLKVSAGTFAPLTREQLESGRLHSEHIDVPIGTAEAVNRAKAEGRPVVAVGTTTVRSLEWAAASGSLSAASGWGDIFIRPGYSFKAVDGLITNFHLPGSSLLMLVSALAGRERVLAAYAEALSAGMNFYSYGDAMLIL